MESKIAVDERLKEILEKRNQRIGVFKDRSCEKFIRDDPDDTIERAAPPAPNERGEQPQVLESNNKTGSSNSDDEMESSSSDDEAEDLPKMEGREAEDVDAELKNNDIESAAKRRRIQLIEKLEGSVQNIMSITSKDCESVSSARCNREIIKKIIGDLDKSRMARTNRRGRRFAEQDERRLLKQRKGNFSSERSASVADRLSAENDENCLETLRSVLASSSKRKWSPAERRDWKLRAFEHWPVKEWRSRGCHE